MNIFFNIFLSLVIVFILIFVSRRIIMFIFYQHTEDNNALQSTTLAAFLNNKKSDVDSLQFVKKQSKIESKSGKGSINNWGLNQKKNIVYIIATSLLKTQENISNVKISLLLFINQVQKCLMCLVQNFSEKYDYSFVLSHIQNIGKDTKFDKWFKTLYNTCGCNDQLGKLLLTLLKQYWENNVINTCSGTTNGIGKCIDKIKYKGFSQVSINSRMSEIEKCVKSYCPELLD